MEERWWAAEENSAVRTLFPDTTGKVTLTEGSPAQSATGPVRVKREEPKDGDAISCPPVEDDDSLNEGVLDEDEQLTPIDDLASLEDEYLLEFECALRSVEKMTSSPSESQREEFTFLKLTMPVSASPVFQKPILRLPVPEPDHQLMPRGMSLIEPPLVQPCVWVHYKVNKLPMPEWRAELSQLQPVEIKEFQVWCLWASGWKQEYGDWTLVPVIKPLQPEEYRLKSITEPLAKLTMVLELDEVHISLLRMMLQVQILAKVSAKPSVVGKLAGAIQWAVSTLGEDQLPFKATIAIFGCVPEPTEFSPGLDSSVLTEFKGSAMEFDVLSAGNLGQETETDTEVSYVSVTEANMETDT